MPAEPVLALPSRVDAASLQAIEQLLGGPRKVAWMVEHSLRPDADIMNLLQKREASGFFVSMEHMSQEALLARIESKFAAGQHVVLLPGRPAQPAACPTDAPLPLLRYLLDAYPHPVLPLYVGMYKLKEPPFITSQEPYEKLILQVLPALKPGPAAAPNVMAAWLGAAAEQAGKLWEGREDTLPHALLHSLLEHPHAKIIDGVDDSQMTYRQLLMRAAGLARQLRRHVANKRIGIILPPGKYSIIANVACLLAGITPVNIDYTYDSAAFESVARQAELNRLITEHRFIQMQEDFPWPLTRDILFIDDVPDVSSFRLPVSWGILNRWMNAAHLSKWIRTPELSPEDEALAIFSPAGEGMPIRGHALSHRAVLAGTALCYSRFRIGAGQSVLSALPYHRHAGLLAGLIQPLLLGQDIITYPLPDAGKRLCHLAKQYKPALAVFTPEQAEDVLAQAAEEDFAATTYFHVVGRVPESTARRIFEERHVRLCECYLPPDCAMPVACSMPPTEGAASALVAGAPGTAGLPMPGVAIRITDMEKRQQPLPLTSMGLVWVKGPGLFSDFSGQRMSAQPAHERWFCTEIVGQVQENGLLVIKGPADRFTKIEGEIIFHEDVERLMLRFLRVEPKPHGAPRLAVVGIPDEQTGQEQLVLLSTVHKVVGPHDVITLRYDLTNAHLSPLMAPSRIVALRAIPTLPGGQVNYAYCRALALRVLGSSKS